MNKYVDWRRVKDFSLSMLVVYGTLWLFIESISTFFTSLRPDGWIWYCVLLLVAVIGGVCGARSTKRIEFQIPGSDSWLEIRFGNIFEGTGVVVIPVNEYFDGELGDHVSEKSLHGRFIKDVVPKQAKTFVKLTSEALAGVTPEESGVARLSGRCDRYAIGTVAAIDIKDQRYLLVALSHTEPSSLKASATVHDLSTCLEGVWKGIRQYSNGQPAMIPLIGSGLSGIGLPPGNLIGILLTSFLYHTKERKVADRVTLVLPPHPHHLEKSIDLKTIKRSWT